MDVVVYTMARKFPRLIGKFPNGQTIPFGPFTFKQIGVLIGGLALTFTAIQALGAPKLPTAVIAAFLIVPGMAATRRLGFSMARSTSRLLWVTRPWIRRSPIATGIIAAAPTTPPSATTTGGSREIFEAD